jgi:hypothetical protein
MSQHQNGISDLRDCRRVPYQLNYTSSLLDHCQLKELPKSIYQILSWSLMCVVGWSWFREFGLARFLALPYHPSLTLVLGMYPCIQGHSLLNLWWAHSSLTVFLAIPEIRLKALNGIHNLGTLVSYKNDCSCYFL